jgi:predicted dehydrogenase
MAASTTRESSGRPLRVACFGAGWVTTNRHIPAMRAHGGFEVVAIADRRGERAREAAERHGIPRHVEAGSVAELGFDLGEIDAVTCGTAPFSHYEVVRSALDAGKHVLTEKPFTMTVPEGRELVDLARTAGRTLAVVHNFQFAAAARRLERWVEQGKVGTPRSAWAVQLSNPRRRLPDWFDELPLGLFYDESPHLLYLLRRFVGELDPVSVTVHPSTRGLVHTPAQIDAQMRHGDLPVMMQINFEAPVSEWHVALMGDEGMAIADVFRDHSVLVGNDNRHLAADVLRTSLRSSWHHWMSYLRQGPRHLRGGMLYGNDEVFARFHQAAVTGERPRDIDAEDALAVLELQHWVVEGAAAGRH